jgi:gentisate 1,2-dioxygenase
LRPVAKWADTAHTPLPAYRWEHTDAALCAQLDLAAHTDYRLEPGHAAVRFTNPTTGRDALPTVRIEAHRLISGARTRTQRTVGSSVWQVFSGSGMVHLGERTVPLAIGDLLAVPSWQPFSFTAADELTLFTFNDAPVYEALRLDRTHFEEDQ